MDGLSVSPAATGPMRIQVSQDYKLHASRQEVQTVERWYRSGGSFGTVDYHDTSRAESYVTYDAEGAAALQFVSDRQLGGPPEPGRLSSLPPPAAHNSGRSVIRPAATPSLHVSSPKSKGEGGKDSSQDDEGLSTHDRIVSMIIERFFGVARVKTLDAKALSEAAAGAPDAAEKVREAYAEGSQASAPPAPAASWVDAGVRRTDAVKDDVEFAAQLTAQVDDGKGGTVTQSVAVKVKVSREYLETSEARLRVGDAPKQDPLVLDLTGTGIDLTGIEQGTVFDLNADGHAERAAMVQGGTALVWMDRNGNGTLDNGSELFGDARGAANGFEALGSLDANGDGRVDAFDPAFRDLRFRTNGAGGAADLTAEAAGVSALELPHVSLPAALGDAASLDAVGVFRRTDGSLGVMADVRLAYEA
jgi:hypothetical protein